MYRYVASPCRLIVRPLGRTINAQSWIWAYVVLTNGMDFHSWKNLIPPIYIYIVRAIFRILIVHFCSNSSPKLTEITGSHNFMNHLISMLEPRRCIFSFMVGIYLYGGPLQYSWHIGCFFKKSCPLTKKATINKNTRRLGSFDYCKKGTSEYGRHNRITSGVVLL